MPLMGRRNFEIFYRLVQAGLFSMICGSGVQKRLLLSISDKLKIYENMKTFERK